MKRDTIKSLAREIALRWPDLRVTVERGYCNTDRKIGRLRRPGKGRTGSRLKVYDAAGTLLLDHNNAETYRHTGEVRRWMDERANTFDRTTAPLRDAVSRWARAHSMGGASWWSAPDRAWRLIGYADPDIVVTVSEDGSKVVVDGVQIASPTPRKITNALDKTFARRRK